MAFFTAQETRLHNLPWQRRIFIVLYLREAFPLLLAGLPFFSFPSSLSLSHPPPTPPPTFLSIVTTSSGFTSSSASSVKNLGNLTGNTSERALFGSAKKTWGQMAGWKCRLHNQSAESRIDAPSSAGSTIDSWETIFCNGWLNMVREERGTREPVCLGVHVSNA